jgi:two-component system sensor histidine kinase KdpD
MLIILVVTIVTVGAFFFRGVLTLANFTMIYLLLVLVIAIRTGTRTALITAFASFVSINFFLVPPYYSLWVADPREVLDLCVFLIVAAIAGQLGARVRHEAREVDRRAREQEILYRLTRAFNQLMHSEGVYEALLKVLHEDLGTKQAYILPGATEIIAGDNTVHYLLLQGGERIYGTVQVAFETPLTASQSELINACVSQAAMALQRIDLSERAIKSRKFEEADKLKTAILHAVSHDLRTPITIIKSSASNLRQLRKQLNPQEEMEIMETIEHETDELDKLVGNLLDLSRLQAGAVTLNRHPNDLEEIAGDVAAQVWQRTRQERIKIIFPDNMPSVCFDYGLLLQAVTNLVDNSLRYEPPEQQIEIHGEIWQKEVFLKVINHGQTISDTLKEHIMEPFYRGHEGRTGLGLPIARGIIETHQGRLWVEDTPGGGATFVLTLPVNRDELNETENSGC